MKSYRGPEAEQSRFEGYADAVARAADEERVYQFPEGFGRDERRGVFEVLKSRGAKNAVLLNHSFLNVLEPRDVEWLVEQSLDSVLGRYVAAYAGEKQNRVMNEIVRLQAWEALSRGLYEGQRVDLSSEVAAAMIDAGYAKEIAEKLDVVEDPGVEVAEALIEAGFVEKVALHNRHFTQLSEKVARAYFDESPYLVKVVGYNLRQFVGLSEETKQRLIDDGFEAEVKRHPEAFASSS